jgi:nucleotide-binding universal stress UspA family protein
MKSILYATDCSPKSGMALRYAHRLSSAMNAQLHVLHVYELAPFVTANVRKHSQLELNFAEEQYLVLKDYCDKELEHEYGPKQLEFIVEENSSISKAVLETSNRIKADLVLAGIKNYQSLRSYFSENVANKLLTGLDVPLLLLPPEVYYHGLSTLVYATDFERADVQALKKLVALVEPYGALIKVVHVPRKKEIDSKQKMEAFETMVKKQFFYPEMVFCTKESEDVETGLSQCIQEELPEMLVMLEREHGYWHDRFFQKDLVEVMEGEISIPLLVFNKKGLKAKFTVQSNYAALTR